MIAGVMQPYLFPYLGYYQLVRYCDRFVFYDDASFIVRGHINRNSLLVQGNAHRFTLSVEEASQNKNINALCFSADTRKLLATIRQNYARAPCFQPVYTLVENVLNEPRRNVAHICSLSIFRVFEYLGLDRQFLFSSDLDYSRNECSAAQKLIAIARVVGADRYCNVAGGKKLYSEAEFEHAGIDLEFISMSNDVAYHQGGDGFVANLSMIDVLMWCSREEVRKLLEYYRIERAMG